MNPLAGAPWTPENLEVAATLISQLAEELAFVVPDQDSGLLAINALCMDLEQLIEAEVGAPVALVSGVVVLRRWIDEILSGPVRFNRTSIGLLGEWHHWASAVLVAIEQGEAPLAMPPEWISTDLSGQPAQALAGAASTTAAPDVEPIVPIQLNLAQDQELLREFYGESMELLQDIERGVLVLEENPTDKGTIDAIFRAFHTFKGSAGFLHLAALGELAHELETLLDAVRRADLSINREIIDSILAGADALNQFTTEIGSQLDGRQTADPIAVPTRHILMRVRAALRGDAPAAPAPVAPAPQVAVIEMPAVVAVIPAVAPPFDEPAAPSSSAPADAPSARAVVAERSGSNEPPKVARDAGHPGAGGGFVKLDTEKLDALVNLVGELVIAQSMVVQNPDVQGITSLQLSRSLRQLSRVTSELQRNAMSMRMVPIRGLFQKMSRLVRDLGVLQGKQVQLVLEGEETELDRNIVEKMSDPLIHMIRNAVDHGLEQAADRAAGGKPATGTIRLSAAHQRGGIVIRIQDDGRGLDAQRILAKAVDRGLVPNGAVLTQAEIFALIFLPGFSTVETVTELSGRGVGMDLVLDHIQTLRGKVEIESEPGAGTTFTILLPLTLAIIDGLLVGIGDDRYIIPTLSVCESFRPRAAMISTVHERGEMVSVRGRQMPLLRLGNHLGVKSRAATIEEGIIVVVESGGASRALLVDQLIGKQEVVIKSLGRAFENQNLVAGGAVLGDGWVGLILDVDTLVKLPLDNRAGLAPASTGTHP
jgi:two-component system chemotaxis sensor kinase CheA